MTGLRVRLRKLAAHVAGGLTDRFAQRVATRLGMDPRAEPLSQAAASPEEVPREDSDLPRPAALRFAEVPLVWPRGGRVVRTVPTLDGGGRVPGQIESKPGTIRVLAEPFDEQRCRLHVGHPFAEGKGWWFGDPDAAEGAPLAASLFQHRELAALLVDDRTVVATRRNDSELGWPELAARLAERLRAHLNLGLPVLPEPLVAQIPLESEIQQRIQLILDAEVNPEVAAHAGRVELLRVRGNSVWIRMGGGCQGCSAAGQTLRHGIDRAFRRAVPALAGIYDDTDHRAGLNPYLTS